MLFPYPIQNPWSRLETSGSVEAVIRAEREELLAGEGVGAKTAERIRWAVSEKQALYGCEPGPGI